MNEKAKPNIKIYEFITFLASSARGLLEEPQSYGPFRCLDAITRFIDLVKELGYSDPYLEELKREIEKGKYLVLFNEEDFRKFIVELNVKLARKIKEYLSISKYNV